MNVEIALHIIDFCKNTQEYSLPGTVRANIFNLSYLAAEWLAHFQQPNFNIEAINSQLHQAINDLLIKMSNYWISADLIQSYSDIVVSYMDRISDKENIVELTSILNKMSINHSPTNLVEDITAMAL